jgi:hypothetical protein
MQNEKLLACRIAWMREYRGDVTGDPPSAGGKYIAKKVVGGEVLNFQPHGTRYYGYVQASRGGRRLGYGRLNLAKHFGISSGVDSVGGVMVVWFAADRGGTGQKVVGVYRNAIVLGVARDAEPSRHVVYRGRRIRIPYNVVADAIDVRFVPVGARRFAIPRPGTLGAPGISNASYLDNSDRATQAHRQRLLAYAASLFDDSSSEDDSLKGIAVAGGQGMRLTVEERAAVEHRAVEAAIKYFAAPSKGWKQEGDYHSSGPFDLVFRKGPLRLHVEVKGTTGPLGELMVTRGEVAHAQDRRNDCALFVLSDVQLKGKPGSTLATGGTPFAVDPWRPRLSDLTALMYRYRVPKG